MFIFERSRLITTTKTTKLPVVLDEDMFNRTTSISTFQETFVRNLPASRSGRSLSEILLISYPNDLESYTINSVTPLAWNRGLAIAYSCEDGIEVKIFLTISYFIYTSNTVTSILVPQKTSRWFRTWEGITERKVAHCAQGSSNFSGMADCQLSPPW